MKKLIIVISVLFLFGCKTLPGLSVVSAHHAALALSACQPLGAEPRYIYSTPMTGGNTRITAKCTSDIEVTFIVKKPKPDVKDV